MSLDRRDFFKTMGIAGLTLAIGNESSAKPVGNQETEFFGMLFDATLCIGCGSCLKACSKSNQLPAPEGEIEPGVIQKTSESRRAVINNYNTSKGEVYIRNQCMHCNEPACAAACLTKAMHKTKEGPVVWDADRCMGCRYCMVSCPFDVPKFEYHSANPRIQKCDMCYSRIEKGKIPACAEACGDALIFGTRRELIAEARKRITENPDDYVDQIYGEHVAGGTGVIYLSPVPFKELGVKQGLQNASYPSLSKGFLYSVPSVFIILPTLLLGIHEATKTNEQNHEH
ncbi:MAG: 4Fe-4S dicluster domain-containing protein [Bacteroidales bacterium]|nr:4Fe-4S dicluster domain-containing protein [Bacteroidales bacterium]